METFGEHLAEQTRMAGTAKWADWADEQAGLPPVDTVCRGKPGGIWFQLPPSFTVVRERSKTPVLKDGKLYYDPGEMRARKPRWVFCRLR